MSENPSGGRQLKKLFYTKWLSDNGVGVTWKISPWKIFLFLLSGFIALIILYGFFATPNSNTFFGDVVFYGVVIVGAAAVLWVVASGAFKFRKIIAGFFLAFILILTFYWVMGTLFSALDLLSFHMGGYSLWLLITILAGLGAKRIDGSLDRNDVGYGLLVLIVIIGANIPVAQGQGFLWNLDNLIAHLLGLSNITTLLGL